MLGPIGILVEGSGLDSLSQGISGGNAVIHKGKTIEREFRGLQLVDKSLRKDLGGIIMQESQAYISTMIERYLEAVGTYSSI